MKRQKQKARRDPIAFDEPTCNENSQLLRKPPMRVLKFIFHRAIPYRWYLFGIFAAMCLITIDNTLKPFLVKQLIDTVSGRQSTNLWLIAIFYGLLQLMLVGSWTLSDYCLTRYVAKFRLDVAEYFMKRLYDYPYSFFQNQLSGSLTSKLNDVFQHLPHLIFTLIKWLIRKNLIF
jgi:ATP-binding cassette, subfamily B, bacterial